LRAACAARRLHVSTVTHHARTYEDLLHMTHSYAQDRTTTVSHTSCPAQRGIHAGWLLIRYPATAICRPTVWAL